MSKSALGTYGFQSGIFVPIIFDTVIAKTRSILFTDGVGLGIILLMQILNVVAALFCTKPKEDDETTDTENELGNLEGKKTS